MVNGGVYHLTVMQGVDQYVYQHQSMGARAEQEIMDVIEHLETFKETDQYLWMAVGDLHDVADGLDLSDAVQKNLTLEERELDELGVTSVKQNYSAKRQQCIKKQFSILICCLVFFILILKTIIQMMKF